MDMSLLDMAFDNGMAILYSFLVLLALGAIFAFLLCLFSVVFKVKEDKRVGEVRKLLPGIDCGACGNAGCQEMAEPLPPGEEGEELRPDPQLPQGAPRPHIRG